MTVYKNENEEKDLYRIILIGICIALISIFALITYGYEIINFKI